MIVFRWLFFVGYFRKVLNHALDYTLLSTTCYLFFLTSCLLPIVSTAQITFERTYGSSASDVGNCAQQTSDGGYIVVGEKYAPGINNPDIYLIKTDSIGDTLWTKTYGGSENDYCSWVQQTTDHGYIIVGETYSFGIGSSDIFLIKTDSLGEILWTKTFGDTFREFGASVHQTSDNGYIITGSSASHFSGAWNVYLIKTDSLGESIWERTYGGSGDDFGSSVLQISEGGYIIVGRTTSFGSGSYDVYLIKTNSNGKPILTKTYGGIADDQGNSITKTSDEGFIITGRTQSFGLGERDVYLIKTTTLGDTIWTKTIGGLDWDTGRSVKETSDGGYIIVGETSSFGPGSSAVFLIKTNSLGNTLWTRTYGGSRWDFGRSVQQTSDGGYIIAGTKDDDSAGETADIYLIKTNGNGQVGIEESLEFGLRNAEFRLLQNQPNPFYQLTALSYELGAPGFTILKIYDITGRLIKILVNEHQKQGLYQLPISNHQLPGSGVYFYRLQAIIGQGDIYTNTKKLILLH
jgi:hypothetical protein